MRLLRTLSTFLFFVFVAFPVFAQTVHQHGYQEIDYETYPAEMMKSFIHVQTWLMDTENEIDAIMKAKNLRVAAWREAILAVPMGDDRKMLNQVNAITNSFIPYVDDFTQDEWATPIETLLKGGDCEDIALLKAVALHIKRWDSEGINSTRLLVGLLNHGNKPVPHAVLEVDAADDKHYIMNNLTDTVITFDDMNLKMKPLYMVDSTGVIGFVKSRHSLASLAASAGARDGETIPIEWDETSFKD